MSLKEELISYCRDVIDNKIVSCKAHKWACQRFLNDLKRVGTAEFPYVFDESKALHFIKWCELFKHTKGILAGEKVKLAPIQKFIFSNIYGWYHKDKKIRRFKRLFWMVGRKNAKSQSLAFMGSYEAMAFGEPASEVYVAGVKRDQSKLVFDEIHNQLKSCPYLQDKWAFSYGKIHHKKSGSVIVPLSKDASRTGDGTNPQLAIIDEYHAHPTSEILDVLASGMGARKQPLVSIISTAGFDLSSPMYLVEYKFVMQLLDPSSPVENDEYFAMVNQLDEGDNPKDIRLLEKANPILFSYENGRKYLESELKLALDVREKMRNFLTKNANIFISDLEQALIPLDVWRKCAGKFPDLRGKKCFIGLDLSSKLDISATAFLFPIEDKTYVKVHCFMPKGTLAEKESKDKVPYRLWQEQGFLTLTEGNVVDYAYIQSYIQKQLSDNDWKCEELVYDTWNSTQFALEMETEGFTVVECPMNLKRLSEPSKAFRDEVYKGNIVHEDNPLLNWCVSNTIVKVDSNENLMPDKAKSRNRIDGLVATIIGYSRSRSCNLENAKNRIANNHWSRSDYSF